MRRILDQTIWVRASIRALCCILRQDTLHSQCLTSPRCINGTSNFTAGGNPAIDYSNSYPGGSRNTPSLFMLLNRDKLRPKGPLGLNADFTYLIMQGATVQCHAIKFDIQIYHSVGGAVASLLVSALDSGSSGPGSSPGQGTALCSWARHFILKVPLFTQVYIMGTGKFIAAG